MSSSVKRSFARAVAITACALCAVGAASAAYVNAELTKGGGNTWDISFTVGEDPGDTVEAFSIYFDWTQASNILVTASPADWDSIAIQADSALTADGYFDSVVLTPGATAGKALEGFAARFDWADAAGPTTLRFTINDPVSFDAIESGLVGLTTIGGGTVPEPSAIALVAAALALVAISRPRRTQHRSSAS